MPDAQGKVVGELATRCRQGGRDLPRRGGRGPLEPFKQRILDLATVREAGTPEALEEAGREPGGG